MGWLGQGKTQAPSGLMGFGVVCVGQFLSIVASSATSFALAVWAYQTSGSALALGIVFAASSLPYLVISPFAGIWVDRYSRKVMMAVSDALSAAVTVSLLILFLFGELRLWHLYVSAFVTGTGNTIQWPAYSAAITTMIPKDQYHRANGMVSLARSAPHVLAPMLAGALYPVFGLCGFFIFDLATFALAIGTLWVVRIPPPVITAEGKASKGSFWHEAFYGFRYIFKRKSLLGLLLFFLAINLTGGFARRLFNPFILARTGNNTVALGLISSAGAIGGLIGGLLITVWGGFKRRVNNIFLAQVLAAVFELMLFGLARNLPAWIVVFGIGGICIPFSNAASQCIWQAKVAPDVQGRVFAARGMIAFAAGPTMALIAGSLADFVTEPAMTSPTGLARTFGGLVGTTAGSGMALQFVLCGGLYLLITVGVFLFAKSVRNLEDILPDHKQNVEG
jgi:MFS transporter, DHA3 family, macrolide efflux protein